MGTTVVSSHVTAIGPTRPRPTLTAAPGGARTPSSLGQECSLSPPPASARPFQRWPGRSCPIAHRSRLREALGATLRHLPCREDPMGLTGPRERPRQTVSLSSPGFPAGRMAALPCPRCSQPESRELCPTTRKQMAEDACVYNIYETEPRGAAAEAPVPGREMQACVVSKAVTGAAPIH